MLSASGSRGEQAGDGGRDRRKQRPLPVGRNGILHREDRARERGGERGEPKSAWESGGWWRTPKER